MYHNRVRFSILVLIEVLRLQESSCKVVVVQLSTLVSPDNELCFHLLGDPVGRFSELSLRQARPGSDCAGDPGPAGDP